jgi:hypothetical protein
MPPKGKQLGVQEGSLLQLLRSAGFQAELPPSTVAWLENAPVFKFLSSKLSQDNFVAPADQQEYTELMMAKGPNADLYDALGSGSDDERDDEQLQDQQGKDEQWMGAASDADVQRQVQVSARATAGTMNMLAACLQACALAAVCGLRDCILQLQNTAEYYSATCNTMHCTCYMDQSSCKHSTFHGTTCKVRVLARCNRIAQPSSRWLPSSMQQYCTVP